MVRKTKEEAQETRNAILDAAERVFQERGVSHTSLAEIAIGPPYDADCTKFCTSHTPKEDSPAPAGWWV